MCLNQGRRSTLETPEIWSPAQMELDGSLHILTTFPVIGSGSLIVP
jgi:hypothetical protein